MGALLPQGAPGQNKARLERYSEPPKPADNKLDFTEIQIPVGPRLGNKVIVADHLHKAFGDRVLIDLSFDLPLCHRRDQPQLAWAKSTLFKMIMGQEEVSGGSLEIGPSVKISTSTRCAPASTRQEGLESFPTASTT